MRRQSDLTQYFFRLFGRLFERRITPEKAVDEIKAVLGGTRVYWQRPPSDRQERITKALKSGDETKVIADRFGVSDRYVRYLKKRK